MCKRMHCPLIAANVKSNWTSPYRPPPPTLFVLDAAELRLFSPVYKLGDLKP